MNTEKRFYKGSEKIKMTIILAYELILDLANSRKRVKVKNK